MRIKIFCALLCAGLMSGVVAVSPSGLGAQQQPGDGEGGDCECLGGCGGYTYMNPCPNNTCSIHCHP